MVAVPVPSGAVETGLAAVEEGWRGRIARLEVSERRLRSWAAVSRRMAAHAARQQLEKERQRLGRELHTGVGQLLAAVRIQVELIDHFLPERSAPVAEALERIANLTADALEQVRSVSRELYLPAWQRLPLPQAITALWERSGVPQRYQAELHVAPLTVEAPPAVKALVFRTAQEGISNIFRHSRATEVRLTLECSDETLVLTLRDNGMGFSAAEEAGASEGIGLRALRDEAAALGAELSVEDAAPGTKLKLVVPIRC